ncbi:LruC domain-containing protein [Aliivibrio fischeri]|uniref:LruC domain-containing protein n=1 Tax=Aliivibrio fischeri TaxID=668 RepID=UPI0012D922CA|nr:LruC domain-containing protein [Aliivibrio fischeri]MUL01728.1 LruC domain-containing protein [Aliivibrio fischeri]
MYQFFKITMLILLLVSSKVFAVAFDSCPSKAYLFQGKPVSVYGINLVTGTNSLLQDDTGLSSNINGVGFNETDRYIYGFDTTNYNVVRLGQNFQATTLNVNGLPSNKTFYVGDVYDHHYYVYRSGTGLYKIDLSPLDSNVNSTLTAQLITSTASVSLTDFAFHPSNSRLYGVDNGSGGLYEFDINTGVATYIGDTGELGTFGAMYFDVDGYLYLSRNQDGQIYRVNLSTQAIIDSGVVPAIKFADGPYSNQNDGARCANAPLIDTDEPATIDFGDAPDTNYGTTLASNGARHEMDGVTWLGASVDGDYYAAQSPDSDDSITSDDEDGVGFVTALEPGLDSVITVSASTTGYLSAWFDWNDDGDFSDDGEQVITDKALVAGSNNLVISVPFGATVGETWSRFRFSQQTGLAYYGGSTSGEVEDHVVTIVDANTSQRHFPSADGYVTIAYEDNWPETADYDMNDMVLRYRITETLKDGDVAKVSISGQLVAVGASYHSGFAVRLAGIDATNIDSDKTRLYYNSVLQDGDVQESGMTEASFIVINDAIEVSSYSCYFYRTLDDCREDVGVEFELHFSLVTPVTTSSMPAMPYDPFLYATPGYYHGPSFAQAPGRSYEVHLADQAPTEKFDTNFYQLAEDTSDPNTSRYFKTSNNMPWALLIYDEWKWPRERVDLVVAYPQFADYTTSGGETHTDWYDITNAIANKYY